MAKARYQTGSLEVEGKTPYYFTRFRVYKADGTSKPVKLKIGLVSKMGKKEAIRRRDELVAQHTNQLPEATAEMERADTKFESFYRERFLVMKPDWSEAHRQSFTYITDKFILPKFGSLAIGKIDKVMVQAHLNTLAPKYSESTMKHIRTKMVEVFEEAVEQEYINRNPASRTKIPSAARAPEQPIISETQLTSLIEKLTDERDRAIFMVGTFCAMRTSEVFGLPWKNFHYDEAAGTAYFMVDQIAYRGKVMKTTKNEASKARAPIGAWTLEAILAWMAKCKDTSPDALIFPSTNRNGRSTKGAPMFAAVWLQKRLQPLARALGIPFHVNFRATRRTAASLVQEHGAALATAQAYLRHASPNTTATVYSKPVPESVQVAVNSYEERIRSAPKPKPSLRLVK